MMSEERYSMCSEEEVFSFLYDTTELIKVKKAESLSGALVAADRAKATTNNVEFWKWMGANYRNDFATAQVAKTAATQKTDWVRTVVQGKGYEWDWMVGQRGKVSKLFSRFDAGNCPTQPGIDVTETSVLNNEMVQTYQHKAYVSTNSPDLHNTPKDAIVVTNREKVAYASKQGYEVEEFLDAAEIVERREERVGQMKKGNAGGQYTFRNVGSTMVKAGVVSCVIGATTEAIAYYKKWTASEITDDEYLEKIMEAGGNAGVTSGITAGLMIPVSSMVTVAGVSSLVTIPIAVAIGAGVDKIVGPCFKRGAYAEYLNKAKYYQNLEGFYGDFIQAIENAAEGYENYMQQIGKQNKRFHALKELDKAVTNDLKRLYDEI